MRWFQYPHAGTWCWVTALTYFFDNRTRKPEKPKSGNKSFGTSTMKPSNDTIRCSTRLHKALCKVRKAAVNANCVSYAVFRTVSAGCSPLN